MTIYRISPRGLEFNLVELDGGRVEIQLLPKVQKSIIVTAKIEDLSSSWYRWQRDGMHIQNAFPYLSNDEREFILTGITKEEWDKMFAEDDK